MLRRLTLPFLALSAVLVASATAAAQPAKPTNPQDSTIAEARARFEEGIKLGEIGDHEAARLKFNQAWALIKTAPVLYNLARAEYFSNHPVESLEHFRAFSKMENDPKITEQQRQRANEYITELSKKVGQIQVEAAPGARITVDGRTIETGTSDPIPVPPGKHTVEAIADGKVRSVSIDCPAGSITKAKLVEDAKPAEPVETKKPEPPPPVPIQSQPEPGFWTTGRIIGTSVGVVGIGGLTAGIIFHMLAQDANADADAVRDRLGENADTACSGVEFARECAELRAAFDNRDTREALRTGFLIGGGTLLVGGAVLFLVSPPSKSGATSPTTGAHVVPIVSQREAGLALVGRF